MFTALTRRSLALVLLVSILPTVLTAAERRTSRSKPKPVNKEIDLFDGMKSGDIDVKLIPRDSREARVLIENKTDQPLSIKLPDAFAATPVLAQIGAGGRGSGTSPGGGMQSMGGGMGGMGMGGMGMGGMGGMGMGMMNVPPEKVGKLKVPCVCLEHGKAEPRAAVQYEIKPYDEYSSDPQLKQVLKLLGKGKVDQRVAQAATWNIANHLSWQELANKKIEHFGGGMEMYFSEAEIRAAMDLVSMASHLAEEDAQAGPEKSPVQEPRAGGPDDPIKY